METKDTQAETKSQFRQEDKEEIADDEREDDDDLFDSPIEATQRDELLESVKAIFPGDDSSTQ